ncbi:DUF2059 domain-containing protein [Bosea sp. 117]|uniref:DUF2059 domain-containing protein n=1 Tax=Bosea sp. 117 TaxID=1125973 RepID=UPI0004941CD9|nr:DUF2059 domain-containing protein [Bosea sp. 117]
MRVPFNRRKQIRRSIGAGLTVLMLGGAVPAMAQTAAPAPAATPEPSAANVALAKELLSVNGEAGSFDALIPGVIEQTAGSFVQANPDLIRELRDVARAIAPEYEARKNEITDILAKVYASHFTEAELKEIVAFYRTPTGKKLVDERQPVLDEGLRSIQAWSGRFAREMEGRIREEMKKRGYTI